MAEVTIGKILSKECLGEIESGLNKFPLLGSLNFLISRDLKIHSSLSLEEGKKIIIDTLLYKQEFSDADDAELNLYSILLLLQLLSSVNILAKESGNKYIAISRKNLVKTIRNLCALKYIKEIAEFQPEIHKIIACLIIYYYPSFPQNSLLFLFMSEVKHISIQASDYLKIWKHIIELNGGICKDITDILHSFKSSDANLFQLLLRNKKIDSTNILPVLKGIKARFNRPEDLLEAVVMLAITNYHFVSKKKEAVEAINRFINKEGKRFVESYHQKLNKMILEELISNPNHPFREAYLQTLLTSKETTFSKINPKQLAKLYQSARTNSEYSELFRDVRSPLWKGKSAVWWALDFILAIIFLEIDLEIKLREVMQVLELYQKELNADAYMIEVNNYCDQLSDQQVLSKHDKEKIECFCEELNLSNSNQKMGLILALVDQLHNITFCNEEAETVVHRRSSYSSKTSSTKQTTRQSTVCQDYPTINKRTSDSKQRSPKTPARKGSGVVLRKVSTPGSSDSSGGGKKKKVSPLISSAQHTTHAKVWVNPENLSLHLQQYFGIESNLIFDSSDESSADSPDMYFAKNQNSKQNVKNKNNNNNAEPYLTEEEYNDQIIRNSATGIWGEAAFFYALLEKYENKKYPKPTIIDDENDKKQLSQKMEIAENQPDKKPVIRRSLLSNFSKMGLEDKYEVDAYPYLNSDDKLPIESIEIYWPNHLRWKEWRKENTNQLQKKFEDSGEHPYDIRVTKVRRGKAEPEVKYIEVKTSTNAKSANMHFTHNEYYFMRMYPKNYRLYCFFKAKTDNPKFRKYKNPYEELVIEEKAIVEVKARLKD